MRVLKSEHTDSRNAGCRSGKILCVQCSGGQRVEARYTTRLLKDVISYEKTDSSQGLKEYSDWPTIPQLYVDKEFVGGCDILMSMHQNGELSKVLEEKGALIATDNAPNETSQS